MPTPPRKGEKQNVFLVRCMDDKEMKQEFPEPNQRIAVCHSYWRKKDAE